MRLVSDRQDAAVRRIPSGNEDTVTGGGAWRRNLPQILAARAEMPEQVAFRFLRDGADDVVDWTYRQLEDISTQIAAELLQRKLSGKRVLLTLEPGLHYIATLFGILKAGAIAVPSFPPAGKRAVARLASIFNDCQADLIIADTRLAAIAERVAPSLEGEAQWWFVDEAYFVAAKQSIAAAGDSAVSAALTEALRTALQAAVAAIQQDTPALLQYTSGSTGKPKGVIITHGNLAANSLAIERHLGPEQTRIGCSWLPPYHDMGLMGAIILSVYNGFTLVTMTPTHFVQNPLRWLKAISDHRVTTSVAPNFALDLCVSSISEEEAASLDLSCLRQVFCGAEPVLQSTLDRFSERFAAAGFSPSAYVPCYGMAEATLFVSGKAGDAPPLSLSIDKEQLALGRIAEVADDDPRAMPVVGCGTIAEDHRVAIVDPESGRLAPAGTVGEIWVHGPNVAQGYWHKVAESQETFAAYLDDRHGPYLRTGDLGFFIGDELFIAGRMKDVVILAGRNLYPQDLELSVTRCHESIRTNGVVAFSVSDADAGEQLIIVAELSRSFRFSEATLEDVRHKVIAAVSEDHGVRPSVVHLAPVGTIPLTTSGKVRRNACKQAFTQGALATIQARAA